MGPAVLRLSTKLRKDGQNTQNHINSSVFRVNYYQMRRSKKPLWQQKIAKERIQILFGLAEREFDRRPERSRRYVGLARKISLRHNIRLDKNLKKKFCKSCNSLLIPGKTSQIRIDARKKAIAIKCLKCNKIYRHPYK